jgi:hypothetical protein
MIDDIINSFWYAWFLIGIGIINIAFAFQAWNLVSFCFSFIIGSLAIYAGAYKTYIHFKGVPDAKQ